MHITKKALDPYTLDAHITLDKGELTAYVAQVTDALAGEATIEGFRKGKAPKELVKKQLDPGLVRQEALEHALEGSFTEATKQETWDVMRTSDLKVIKNDADMLEYSIRVALWPAVELADLSTVKIPRKAVDVSEAEIDEALDTIRNMRATFLDKTGAAGQGDRLEVDFDASVGGQAIEGGQSRNHPLIIGGKSFMPGFEDALVGVNTGQTKEFSLVAPDDYYEPKLAGKKVDFKATVNRVQTVLKPAADDAFAASLGKFKDVSQLKENLRAGIHEEKKTKEHQRVRLAILDAVIAVSKVPAPDTMVKDELDDMVKRFGDDLQSRGIELAMYLARLNKSEDALRKDWKKEAERQVHIVLVLRQIAKNRNISVSPGELEQALNNTVAELLRSGQLQQEQVDPERIRSALAQRMLTDKTLEAVERLCAIDES